MAKGTMESHEYYTCALLGKFHRNLTRFFHDLGYTIGRYPSYFIIIPVFLSLLAATGVQQMRTEKDPTYLFSPTDGQGKREQTWVQNLFTQNYSDYDPSRMVGIDPATRILVSAKDNGSMFRMPQWDELNMIDEIIRNFTIVWEEDVYTYEDLCATSDGKCLKNLIFNLNEIMPEVANGSFSINYPIMLYPYMFPFFYGGPTIDHEKGIITATEAISLGYFLKAGNSKEKERSLMFEKVISNFFVNTELENTKVAFYVSRALEDELDRSSTEVIPYFMMNLILIFAFSFFSVGFIDWVRSKFFLGIIGIVSAGMAMGTSFGLLMYLQVPFIGINTAIPFLILGIGLDDQFVLLSGWQRTNPSDSVPMRLAEAYSEAAVSITITSLTNVLSFMVGYFSPFPSVSIFCLYTGVCVIFTYIWFITFFGGVLALAGRAEVSNTHSLVFRRVQPKSVAKENSKSKLYRMFCAGGISMEDPSNPKDNKKSIINTFFGDYLAVALSKPIVKGIVLFIFSGYMAGAIYGITNLQEGLERRNLAMDDSFLIDFFDKEDLWFRHLAYRVQIVVNETLDYSDPEVEEKILDLHHKFENSSFVGDRLYSQSWIRHFYRYLERKPDLKANITDEASFIKVLKEVYLVKRPKAIRDIVFNEDQTKIRAIRFIVQTYNVSDTNADKDMMLEMRAIANAAPYDVFTYHPFFIFFDQFMLVRITSIQSILFATISMMIVSIIFIPHPLCCLGVAFSIVSIELGVVGYMALWGVRLDSISMINLIMCIGFSVDFSAHVSYAFVSAKVNTSNERIKVALQSLGLPVVQGALSTIIGVLFLYFAPSYIFQTFFKIVFLVIIFGIAHGLLLLPVILSLIGPRDRQITPSEGPGMTDIVVEQIPEIKKTHLSALTPDYNMKGDSDSLGKDFGIGSSVSSQHASMSDIRSETQDSDAASDHSQKDLGVQNSAYVEEEDQVERL